MLGTSAEYAKAMAAQRAANPEPPSDSSLRVALVYRGFPQRAELLAAARPLMNSAMADALVGIRRDPVLSSVGPLHADSEFATPASLVLAAVSDESPIAHAAEAEIDGLPHLALFVHAEGGSLADAALIRSVGRAVAPGADERELDQSHVPDAVLRTYERPVAAGGDVYGAGESDGRWVWAVVLALLFAETVVRQGLRGRRPRAAG
jgi:hypothetical protein